MNIFVPPHPKDLGHFCENGFNAFSVLLQKGPNFLLWPPPLQKAGSGPKIGYLLFYFKEKYLGIPHTFLYGLEILSPCGVKSSFPGIIQVTRLIDLT